MGFICANSIFAQPVLTPKNLALGGGGTTYITDFNANFYNPANLLINDRARVVDIGFLSSGSFFNGVLNFEDLNDQKDNYLRYFNKFESGEFSASQAERDLIIDTHYKRDRLSSLMPLLLVLTGFLTIKLILLLAEPELVQVLKPVEIGILINLW